ncbi:Prolyl 3-hydroxylase OGFOD1 [Strongyloides ratti]|uniref:Prolyl 3-hydroxylase OGFOD1 n=1 Tax=Strongyloides ratti TaxID=34506 RepID=A0A090LEQ4_STRRB|nr:Prolyl 3-hydroxylase OGFOD1 [Strongyloides ratti]CEF68207.1 Prolyl 3-hydroxylase OGFOD1 [Strongyloides ratti]
MDKNEYFKINDIYLKDTFTLEKENKPFPVKILKNFVENEEALKELKKALKETLDLSELPENEDKQIIKSFVQFIKEDVKEYIKKVTGFELTDKVTLTGSSYKQGNYLLPHNDQISNRKVAFILYLNDKDKKIEGGKLNLFDVDENEFPLNVVYISNKSWHEVEEILNSNVERLSINGWFHVKDDIDIVRKDIPDPIKEIIKEDFDLSLFLSNRMLDDKYMTVIKKRFEEDSYVALADFLKSDVLENINKELKKVKFKQEGPWHKKNIMVIDDDSLEEDSILKKFLICSQSDTFMKYFSYITGLHFVDIPGAVTSYNGIESKEETDDVEESGPSKKAKLDIPVEDVTTTNEKDGEITMCHKFYRISKKCYICGDDQVAEKASKNGWSLDIKFFFTDTEWNNKEFGGYTSYITPYNEKEIFRIEPFSNVCFIVFKEPKCFDITKYVKHCCGDNYMNCLSITYMGLNNDVDEEEEYLDEETGEGIYLDEEFDEENCEEEQHQVSENIHSPHEETDEDE